MDHVQKGKEGTTPQAGEQSTTFDNFYTPQNQNFYSNFRYQKLSKPDQEVRLLSPRDPLDPSCIEFDLIQQVSIQRFQKYSTISYHSGDPKATSELLIDGHSFNAFANLARALTRVIKTWKEEFPSQQLLNWADQICINQSDAEERGHQVNMMREIIRVLNRRLFVLGPASWRTPTTHLTC